MAKGFLILARLLTLLFLAGNTLCLILIIISGSTNSFPIDKFYWVEGNTSGIPNAPDITRWTFWGVCSKIDDRTYCQDYLSPASPISPVDNFHTRENVPERFISNRNAYYYLPRFAFCFFWVSLAFIGVAFILYIISWFSNEFTKVLFILMSFGFVFNMTAVVLETAVVVLAKNAFHSADREASLGAAMLGMGWTTAFLSMVEFAMCGVDFVLSISRQRKNQEYEHFYQANNLEAPHVNNGFFSKKRWFSSKKGNARQVSTGLVLDDKDAYMQPPTAPPPPIAEPMMQPLQAEPTVAPQQPQQQPNNQRRGINFFTIRNSNKMKDDESM
ncbi:hypothetical protein Kpol_1013p26 [Vanderwaltozyma polyspora DSM 70294]|uniref:Protein SUR7 n=1 Tax=Vanderwaltozyma polyspora (strain ATCC 22028 / DSM 70294 / BCRC 21397 / CBS 2163 / NBRC 10782 / NRRL Y-8283 / UCD 57-17) TaxID=436907 RepID=A7TH74_VANPO|nr:uncharacterized protein Kpol_1013p26 [Vanderwaltozyma polyspora DSM 70294]EDO18355.1 hypothetical protein Kpol_1013p26 [Vanderwaltozyma polyspora DSM 70294]